MLFYVIVGLIIVIALIVGYGAFMRRKIYKDVDRYANWKISVMNRPITDEISKVKKMTMGGETEKKFEEWRRDWDEIITLHLPNVEEALFEAEECADKYRFKKAREVLATVDEKLNETELKIGHMLEDLNVVVESEAQNKKNIIPIKERYHDVKKTLITRRGDFKKAIGYFENELKELEEKLEKYDLETSQGNVILGREILTDVMEQLDHLEADLLDVPKYYKDIKIILPNRIKELEAGLAEMTEKGYVLDHLEIETFINELQNHLIVYETALENASFKEVKEGLAESFEQLEWIYTQLEKEVEVRHALIKEVPSFRHDLTIVAGKIEMMNQETEEVKKSYLLDEEDFKTRDSLDAVFEELQKEFEEVDIVFSENKQAFSILFEKVEDMRGHLKDVHSKTEAYLEKLHHLRHDELAAKESLQKLKQRLNEAKRLVQKSNLPGIPQTYVSLIEDSDELLSEVRDRLDEKPLAMETILQLLEESEAQMDLVHDKTLEMVDSANFTEQLIQYGNRYRRQNPRLDEELKEAEAAFRSYNYGESVEIAASAINKIDPGALKKFQIVKEEHIS
ncbi:septation ring formation regulator EzrA [Pullulanibacillus sp. KACC 23026]|uniref:septation ring formation regulator EzrA n=1 Tax=Pullulanibacillus sp. KACC 23026 TaxID=3028315 RepID=UPI0023B09049|nr:septation ring formation regulator EzrA [Pullulanibacillus sp. KACC 23026]WEG13875.1 septation ring formation regulator EzrA [Pullulanibacillus sp. KACC 23026]